MPMFVIDDRDEQGQLGLSVFIARNEQQAIKKFLAKHPRWEIDDIEHCEWLELAMVDERGATSFRRRARRELES